MFFLLGDHLIYKKVPNEIKLFAWRACKEILAINRKLEKNGKNHRKSLWHVQESKWKHSSCSGGKCKCEYASKVWNIAFPIIQILNRVQWQGNWKMEDQNSRTALELFLSSWHDKYGTKGTQDLMKVMWRITCKG